MGHRLAGASALSLASTGASALVSPAKAATIRHFIECLTHDRPFETPPEDNLKTLRLVEDCYRLSEWDAA
jgi:hypothetical protein